MQIREISLKELYEAYELVKKIRDISYEEFEDLVYEMKENYIMIGVFDKEKLLSYAGLSIITTLKDKRHIRVYDLAFLDEKSLKELKDYLEDYAKISMAKKVIYE
jgi:hypothetical protein